MYSHIWHSVHTYIPHWCTHTYTYIGTCTQHTQIRAYTHTHIHMYTYTHTQTHVHRHMYTDTCTHTHIHRHMYTDTYVRTLSDCCWYTQSPGCTRNQFWKLLLPMHLWEHQQRKQSVPVARWEAKWLKSHINLSTSYQELLLKFPRIPSVLSLTYQPTYICISLQITDTEIWNGKHHNSSHVNSSKAFALSLTN